jgi:hypothetical protein
VLGVDLACIRLNVYDQFNQSFPNAALTFECDSPTDLCDFRLTNEGLSVFSGTADVNGELRLRFSSIRSGNKLVSIYNSDHVLLVTIPVTVTSVINCDGTVLSIANLVNDGSAIIGLDVPELTVLVVDRNGDPMSGIDVEFDYTNPAPLPTRRARTIMPTNINVTDVSGTAIYDAQNPSGPANTRQWTAAPGTCEAKLFNPLVWYWGVDCPISNLALSNPAPYKDQTATVSGKFFPLPGASITGAQIYLTTPGNIPMTLGPDGTFLMSFNYDSNLPDNFNVQVSFPDASKTCNLYVPIQWQTRVPSCETSTLTFGTGTTASSSGSPVAAYVTIRDSNGVLLPGINWSVYSVSRAGRVYAFSFVGVTGPGGQSTFYYPNDGFGAHPDVLQVTVTRPGTTDCTFSTTLNWI